MLLKMSTMKNTIKFISPLELNELRSGDKSIEIIDVRTPMEFHEVHIEMAENIPLDSLDPEEVMRTRHGNSALLYTEHHQVFEKS